MSHTCHADGCTKQVPRKLFMCRAHWYKVRPTVRDAIWRHYKPGQEDTKTPSASYMAVHYLAVGEVAAMVGRKGLAKAGPIFAKAWEWRERAIAGGAPDPLLGLISDEVRRMLA